MFNNLSARRSYGIGTVHFVPCSLLEAVSYFVNSTVASANRDAQRLGVAAHFANAYSLALADSDPHYRGLLEESDLVFMDGKPVLWAAKLLYRSQMKGCTRVYGPDVMRGVLAESDRVQRHFFLGSTPETLNRLQAAVAHSYPNARIVGSYSPPFNDRPEPEELRRRDGLIAAARPTHIWVGLGTPKQDFEVARLAKDHQAFVFGVGAAFDFLSGSTPEAPKLIQALGLQWAHRLILEPRRLARRYLWGNPRFVWSVMRNVRTTREV